MSYPPPPGLPNSSNLPPRPPPPSTSAFTRFAPRQVAPAAPQPSYAAPPADYSSAYSYPATSYAAPTSYAAAPSTYSSAPATYSSAPATYSSAPAAYAAAPSLSAAPHIVNPFPLPQQTRKGGDPRYADLDPELQAQIAQQQSIYDPQNAENLKARTQPKPVVTETSGGKKTIVQEKVPTVIRQGGGQTWTDPTLLEWDPSHHRLFVGNLAGEVTDDSLLKAFSKYSSVQKARVVRDKRTTKSKGYGFVAFSDSDDYFRAFREMQGKYIGSHPVLLKRSNTEIKPVVTGGGGKTKGGRVEKKKGKKKSEVRKVLG